MSLTWRVAQGVCFVLFFFFGFLMSQISDGTTHDHYVFIRVVLRF